MAGRDDAARQPFARMMPRNDDAAGHLAEWDACLLQSLGLGFAPGALGQVADFFGGTGLLIVVGVALDTMKQIESQLLMRHYEGFMKKGRIRGRFS